MADKSLSIRLAVVDGGKVRAELRDVGEAGGRAMQRVEEATRPASRALLALNEVTGRARGAIDEMAGSAGTAGAALGRLGPIGLTIAAGLGAAVTAALATTRAVLDLIAQIDHLDDQAQRVGLGVERFEALVVALQGTGVEAEATETALAKLNDAIGEVRRAGTDAPKELQRAFADLGISLAQVVNPANDARDILGLVADGVANLDDAAKQTSAAMALFGRSAADLLPTLRQGAAGIVEAEDAARSLAAVHRQDLAEAYSTAGDRLALLDAAIRVARAEAFLPFVDTTVRVREVTLEAWQVFGALIDRVDAITARVGAAGRAFEDWSSRIARAIGDAARAADAAISRATGLPPTIPPRQAEEAAQTAGPQATAALPAPALPSPVQRALAAPPSRAVGARSALGWDLGDDKASKDAARRAREAERDAERLAKSIEDALGRETDAAEKAQRALATLGDERQRYVADAVARLPDGASAAQRAEMSRRAGASFDLAEQLRLAERYRTAMDALTGDVAEAQSELAQFGGDRAAAIDAELRRFGANMTSEQRAAAEALAEAKVAAGERLQLLRDGKAVIEASMTPAERYAETLKRLDEMLAGGAIDGGTAERAKTVAGQRLHEEEMQRLAERRDAIAGLSRAWIGYAEEATDAAANVEQVTVNAFQGMEDALVAFVSTGKLDFRSLVDAMIADLTRIAVRQAMGSVVGAAFSAVGQLIGTAGAASSGGAGPTGGGFSSGLYSTQMNSYGSYHAGGVVGVDAVRTAIAPAAAFASAPRYHTGGMVAGDVPAVLQRGEVVFTPGQMAAMRGARQSVVVHVHNHAGARVSVSETQGAMNERQIAITVDRMIAARLADPSSASARAAGLARMAPQR